MQQLHGYLPAQRHLPRHERSHPAYMKSHTRLVLDLKDKIIGSADYRHQIGLRRPIPFGEYQIGFLLPIGLTVLEDDCEGPIPRKFV